MWQLDERTRIYGPSDFDPRAGEREWPILRIQPCRFTDCTLREHWEWAPGWYDTEAEALANARELLSGEPWPRQSNEAEVRIDAALVEWARFTRGALEPAIALSAAARQPSDAVIANIR